MHELIDAAEDDTLDPADWDEIAVDLAERLSCHLHKWQEASPIALVKAIKSYCKTFEINEPFQPHRYAAVEDPAFDDGQSHHDAYSKTPRPSRTVKSEEGRDVVVEALLEDQNP
jgi:hypothetical protein